MRRSRFARALVLPCLVLALAGAAAGFHPAHAAAPAPEAKAFVDVRITGEDTARTLSAEGFDIAGVDHRGGFVGVIATESELARLARLGYVYRVRETFVPGAKAPSALAQYTDPAEMAAFVNQVVAAYPNLAKKVMLKDTLFEGQQLYAVHVTKDVDQPNDRPTFVLDGQHHAREVMTAEITRDALDWLTSRYASDSAVKRWVDNINIWIVPVVNPDGAMYVFQHDVNWRKNRDPLCAVDLNRNYPFLYGSCNGSSGSCSSDTYRGPSPASEPETQGMEQLNADAHGFFSLSYHSYGEYLMYSYGCNDPDEKAALDATAQALNAILPNDQGTTGLFRTGPIWSTIYSADGGSVDSQYALHGSYAFVIEVNQSNFQPDYATWRNVTVQRQRVAWQYFLDKTLDGPQVKVHVTAKNTGAPLAGAQVAYDEVTYTHGEAPRRTDARGYYRLLAKANTPYHVTASAAGYCPLTQAVSVATGPAALEAALDFPVAPTGAGAQGAGDGAIRVTWTAVPGASGYRVLRGLSPAGPFTFVGSTAAGTTTYLDSGLSGSVPYSYVVHALAPCESGDSNVATATTTGPCLLAPSFAGLASAASAGSSACTNLLTWPAASAYCAGPLTYRVYRSTTASFVPGPATLVAAGLTGTQYADHGALQTGTVYFYVVRAADATSGVEDANVVTLSAAPYGPAALGTWTDDAGDTGTAKLVVAAPWAVQATGGAAGPRVYATGSYANDVCANLTTPAITLQTGAVLTFASKYDMETNYDAGIVEVATGPLFANWTKLAVNYPDSLTNSGNSCGIATGGAGTAFSRTIAAPAYSASPYTGSLAAYANQDVKLRFRFGTDGGVTGAGWWIDDVRVTNALIPGSCTAGAVPTPREASPFGAALTAARAAGAIAVAYTPACGALDHAAFWGHGTIAGNAQWTGAACGLGTTGRASFDPGAVAPGDLLYFVVVGQNAAKEGSYGQRSDGTERPEASGVGACDRPRDLSGVCP